MTVELTVYFLGDNVALNTTTVVEEVAITIYDGYFSDSGSGAVDSVNGKTGTVVLNASDIAETPTLKWLTSTLKTAYDGAVSSLTNKVDKVAGKGLSEIDFTSTLKSAYDAALTSISDIYQQLTGKADKSIVKYIVGSFNTNASLTGVTTEQILGTISIPANTYASNGNMQMEGLLTKLGTSGSVTFRVRVSTDQVPATISSATLVATFGGNSTNLWFPFRRYNIHIDSDTSMICHTPSSSIADDITALTSITSLAVNQTVQQYYHITGQLTNAADIVTLKKFIIYK